MSFELFRELRVFDRHEDWARTATVEVESGSKACADYLEEATC